MTCNALVRAALAAGLLCSLNGCSRSDASIVQRSASIGGDFFLAMQSGDTKRAAAQPVYLIPYSGQLDSSLTALCRDWAERAAAIVLHDALVRDSLGIVTVRGGGAAFDALMDRIPRLDERADSAKRALYADAFGILEPLLKDTARADVNGHFQFDSIPAGRYVLFSGWIVGQRPYNWWVPVTVAPNTAMKRDLDNSVEGGEAPFCGVLPVDGRGKLLSPTPER